MYLKFMIKFVQILNSIYFVLIPWLKKKVKSMIMWNLCVKCMYEDWRISEEVKLTLMFVSDYKL